MGKETNESQKHPEFSPSNLLGVKMWYKTKEEAEEACEKKEKEFKEEFIPLKDSEFPDCWWAQRKSAIKKL
jgi:hypothetical protein